MSGFRRAATSYILGPILVLARPIHLPDQTSRLRSQAGGEGQGGGLTATLINSRLPHLPPVYIVKCNWSSVFIRAIAVDLRFPGLKFSFSAMLGVFMRRRMGMWSSPIVRPWAFVYSCCIIS